MKGEFDENKELKIESNTVELLSICLLKYPRIPSEFVLTQAQQTH